MMRLAKSSNSFPPLSRAWHRLIFATLVGSLVTPSLHAETIPAGDFEVNDGFEVTTWATTPQLYNPTNFDVDAKGRIWVTEAVNYRNFRNEALGLKREDGDRVVVLEDTDGDGKADSSHTFVRDPEIVAPLGIGVVGNKVIVSCAPSIFIYTDIDGDTRFDPSIDTKETFLTGFRGRDHDHSLHSVKVGPDGYWYFNVGNGGAHTVTDKAGWTLRAGSSYAGGSPYLTDNKPGRKSDDGRIWVGGVAMRIRPDGTGLEPLAHNFRNPYEEAVTSFGDVFHSDNDDPPACRTTWIMESGNAGFASADGSRTWKADRRPGQSVRVAEWRQEDPGTLPSGDVYGYGAPTGIVHAENGCFDKQFPHGLLLSCESARGEIFGYVPKPQGAGFALERFVFMKVRSGSVANGWFRPSDVAIGADGAIYVSDWYDAGVGGHRMSDATGSGTIYRITPKGFQSKNPKLDLSTTTGQIAALKNPAVNVRALGFEALKRDAVSSRQQIIKLSSDPNPFFAARAIWLLPDCGQAGIARTVQLLSDQSAQTRITALRSLRRASVDQTIAAETFHNAIRKLANDRSSAVRREVALSLRDVPFEQSVDTLKHLFAGFDGWDRWYLEALGAACEGKEQEAYALLIRNSPADPTNWDRKTAELAWRLHPAASVDALATRAMSAELPEPERKQMINALAFIKNRQAAESMLTIATDGPEDLRGLAAWWGKNRHTNDWKTFDLGERFPEPPPIKVAPKTRQELDFVPAGEPVVTGTGNQVAIDVDIRGAKRLYIHIDSDGTTSLDSRLQSPTLVTTNGRTDITQLKWITAFSGAYPTGMIKDDPKKRKRPARTTLPAIVRSDSGEPTIVMNGRSAIAYDVSEIKAERFTVNARVDAGSGDTSAAMRFAVYVDKSPLGTAIGDLDALKQVKSSHTLGRALFFSSRFQCGTCHTAQGYGGEIGPDLTQIARKHAPPVLLEAILKPSAAIATGFETMTVVTQEGRVHSGLLISAGDPVVVKDANGKFHTVSRDDVEQMMAGKTSIMPEMKELLTAEETASLIAFLQELAATSSM